jgi:16S rRNA (uracil1498-N3)-methyltransferase
MRRFLVERDAIKGTRAIITGAPFHHAARVVRLRRGDLIALFDGSGAEWIARVASVRRDQLEAEILREASGLEPPVAVTLLQAVLKGERMDWLVQKCSELGVARLVPMLTERAVARAPADRAPARRKRWQRISDSAAEQCGRCRPMAVEAVAPLAEAARELAAADLALVPHEAERNRGLRDLLAQKAGATSVAIAIGPEGGFTEGEAEALVAAGGVRVSLGPCILRAETAALFAASAVLYALGDLGSASTAR